MAGPALHEVVADMSLASQVAPEAVTGFLIRLAAVQTVLAAHLEERSSRLAEPLQLVKIEVVAEMLGTTVRWVYDHADELPFAIKVSPRQLRFDLRGLQRYMEEQRRKAAT